MGGKTRNIAIQLVLQQCCKTSCTFLLPVLPHPKKRRRRRRRQRERQKSRRKSQRSFPRPLRLCISVSYPKEQAGQSEGLGINRKFTRNYKLQQTRVEITHFFQNTVKIILAVIKVLLSFSLSRHWALSLSRSPPSRTRLFRFSFSSILHNTTYLVKKNSEKNNQLKTLD